jgi:hypothetical protein
VTQNAKKVTPETLAADEKGVVERFPGAEVVDRGSEGSTEVAQTGHAAVETAKANPYGDDAGLGFEGVGSHETLIPFIRILQPLSPQCTEGEPGYDPEAKPGMFVNTATGQFYEGRTTGLMFIPCARDHSFPEFTPRDAGGGFHGMWPASDPRIAELQKTQGHFGKLQLENGHELTETMSLFGLTLPMLPDGSPDHSAELGQVVFGFSSTSIKTYKMIITRLLSIIGSPPRYPIFAHAWVLRTVMAKNKKGSWFAPTLSLLGGSPKTALMKQSDPLYQQARGLALMIKEGHAKADFAADGGGSPSTGDGGAAGTDDEIPF